MPNYHLISSAPRPFIVQVFFYFSTLRLLLDPIPALVSPGTIMEICLFHFHKNKDKRTFKSQKISCYVLLHDTSLHPTCPHGDFIYIKPPLISWAFPIHTLGGDLPPLNRSKLTFSGVKEGQKI